MPIYSPRSQYNRILEQEEILLDDITNKFDLKTINFIKFEFSQRNNKLTKLQFMKIMKDVYECKSSMIKFRWARVTREEKVLKCLIKLFNEIDIDNDGFLQKEEFLNYISRANSSRKESSAQLQHEKAPALQTLLQVQDSQFGAKEENEREDLEKRESGHEEKSLRAPDPKGDLLE